MLSILRRKPKPDLYDVARKITQEFGGKWTDPRPIRMRAHIFFKHGGIKVFLPEDIRGLTKVHNNLHDDQNYGEPHDIDDVFYD